MTLVDICLVIPQRMRLSRTVTEIWPFEFLPGSLFQEQRLVIGRSVVGRSMKNSVTGTYNYHLCSHIISSNLPQLG